MSKILLGLTTTPGSDWREKVSEIDRFGIKEVALFPTYLKPEERQILYQILEKTSLESIAFVHLRQDFDVKEVDYLANRYKVKLFNIHPDIEGIKGLKKIEKYRDQIYLENLENNMDDIASNLDKCAGICIDFSHWEAAKRDSARRDYSKFVSLINKKKIKFCHISGILDAPRDFPWDPSKLPTHSWHYMEDVKNLNYIKNYTEYLPEILGLELENSFEEQLKAKEYLEKLISK